MSNKSILHEVLPARNMRVLTFMFAMSGYRAYSVIDGNEYFFFREGHFARKVFVIYERK